MTALMWNIGSASVPELIVLADEGYREVSNPGLIKTALDTIAQGSSLNREPPREAERALMNILRRRLASIQRGPVNPGACTLIREVLRRARVAAKARSRDELTTLDAVLERLSRGVPVGAERDLTTALESGRLKQLKCWVATARDSKLPEPRFQLDAAVFCCPGAPDNEMDGGSG